VHLGNWTFLIDIHTLGDKAFSNPSANGQTLREIRESDSIPKVFFDTRNDSDALFSHFRTRVASIHDIELVELVSRKFSKRYFNGLSKCIGRLACKETKERGLEMFAPERGGS
jgi:exonuclease 3'-5' domain-containing protein 1